MHLGRAQEYEVLKQLRRRNSALVERRPARFMRRYATRYSLDISKEVLTVRSQRSSTGFRDPRHCPCPHFAKCGHCSVAISKEVLTVRPQRSGTGFRDPRHCPCPHFAKYGHCSVAISKEVLTVRRRRSGT